MLKTLILLLQSGYGGRCKYKPLFFVPRKRNTSYYQSLTMDPEKDKPRPIIKISSYKPLIATDEDGDLIIDTEALNTGMYFFVSVTNSRVVNYVSTLKASDVETLLAKHYTFSDGPTADTIISVYMPELSSYCFKGNLPSVYLGRERLHLSDAQSIATLDILHRYAAARIRMDNSLRAQRKTKMVRRGFIYR